MLKPRPTPVTKADLVGNALPGTGIVVIGEDLALGLLPPDPEAEPPEGVRAVQCVIPSLDEKEGTEGTQRHRGTQARRRSESRRAIAGGMLGEVIGPGTADHVDLTARPCPRWKERVREGAKTETPARRQSRRRRRARGRRQAVCSAESLGRKSLVRGQTHLTHERVQLQAEPPIELSTQRGRHYQAADVRKID